MTTARITQPRWIVSVDLGQSIDPTAIAIMEVTTRRAAHDLFWSTHPNVPPHYITPPKEWYAGTHDGGVKFPNAVARIDLRHLERLPLRVSYPEQVAHVGALLRRQPLDSVPVQLVCDQTGVGRPIVDMFRRAGLKPIGCTITAGNTERHSPENYRDFHVAKLLLVSRLQAALHGGVLRIADTLKEAKTLVSELQDFRGVFTDTGYARFGAREGAHDDLVLAVAMGVWYASRDHHTVTTQAWNI